MLKSNPTYCKKVATCLKVLQKGFILKEAFSQNAKEIIFWFTKDISTSFFLLVNCNSDVGLVDVLADFKKAKKNTAQFFINICGCTISEVYHIPEDRQLSIKFSNHYYIHLKLFGNAGNVVLSDEEGIVQEIFLKSLSSRDEKKIDINCLVPIPECEQPNHCISEIHHLYKQHCQWLALNEGKDLLRKFLSSKLKKVNQSISNIERRLYGLKAPSYYIKLGNLILAHKHTYPETVHQDTIEVLDYETETMLTIPVKNGKSLVESAKRYFSKAQNQIKEEAMLYKKLETTRIEQHELMEISKQFDEEQDLQKIKLLVEKFSLNRASEAAKKEARKPYWEFLIQDFKVWIGKSASDNDVLTLKLCHKDDLWLHASDVAGSHVIIKHIPNKTVPKQVREIAASWAAYFSKRKNDSLVPVIITQKKYIRKSKGMPAGMIKIDQVLETLMIAPKKPVSFMEHP